MFKNVFCNSNGNRFVAVWMWSMSFTPALAGLWEVSRIEDWSIVDGTYHVVCIDGTEETYSGSSAAYLNGDVCRYARDYSEQPEIYWDWRDEYY